MTQIKIALCGVSMKMVRETPFVKQFEHLVHTLGENYSVKYEEEDFSIDPSIYKDVAEPFDRIHRGKTLLVCIKDGEDLTEHEQELMCELADKTEKLLTKHAKKPVTIFVMFHDPIGLF